MTCDGSEESFFYCAWTFMTGVCARSAAVVCQPEAATEPPPYE